MGRAWADIDFACAAAEREGLAREAQRGLYEPESRESIEIRVKNKRV
jgi:hypothetical protein